MRFPATQAPWDGHDASTGSGSMRLLLSVTTAASLLMASAGHAQVCRGHTGWAAIGYRQGIAMRWFQEYGRTMGPDDAEKACNDNAECRDYLKQRCAYR